MWKLPLETLLSQTDGEDFGHYLSSTEICASSRKVHWKLQHTSSDGSPNVRLWTNCFVEVRMHVCLYMSIQPNICHTREISLCELFYVYIHIIRAKYFGCSVVVISFRYFLLLNQNKLHLLIVVAQTCSYYCICVCAYVGDIRHITASGCSFTTSLIYGHCQWCNSATSDRCIYRIFEQQHRPHHTTTNGFTQNFKECSAHTSKHTHIHIHLYLRPYTPQAENR